MLIDDFARLDGFAPGGACWTVASDRVMGGVSVARAESTEQDGRRHRRLWGTVSLANNGGFIQTALSLDPENRPVDASGFTGIRLQVNASGEGFAVHLRTPDCTLPWQHYKGAIPAGEGWRIVTIPFPAFVPYRTHTPLDTSRLLRLGLVAAGREFEADLRVARIEFVKEAGVA